MHFDAYLHSPKSNPWIFYGLYTLFLLNEVVLKKERYRAILWQWMKCELFYIAGACQHSGMCCRRIELVCQGQVVGTQKDYQRLMQPYSKYDSFLPHYHRTNPEKIVSFSCQWLTKNNRCRHYQDRPLFCRQYPLSAFIQHGHVYDGCGYYVALKDLRPVIRNKAFLDLMATIQIKTKSD